jgi:AcrR family transcriptional regulator
MGPAGSENWNAMLDAADKVLREEGYAALTSRRIADHLGIKQRLVYYYFKTMDDLIVEMFRRASIRELESLRNAAASQRPLTQIWYIGAHAKDSKWITECMALANHVPGLRKEVIAFIEESRRVQVEAITSALKKRKVQLAVPPPALAIIGTSVALSIGREAELGTTSGHAAVMEVIWRYLRELDNEN